MIDEKQSIMIEKILESAGLGNSIIKSKDFIVYYRLY